MYITNVTEIRQNASKVIARVVEGKEPAVVLQRSKPVAYIVEAAFYDELQARLQEAREFEKAGRTKAAIDKITEIRESMAKYGRQPDSTKIIREIREGKKNE